MSEVEAPSNGCKVIFKPCDVNAICPKRHTEGAAGYDLHAISAGCIPPYSTITLKMGFSLKLPPGIIGFLCGRSGFALRNGINVQNSYVLDDSEVAINIINRSSDPFVFEKGTRIAQLFFPKVEECHFEPKKPVSN